MKLNLYLDDNREIPEGWVGARNAEQAMLLLMTNEVQRLSCDYDLFEPDCGNCNFSCTVLDEQGCHCQCHRNGDLNGLDLLQWIHKNNRWPAVEPEVHSANHEGAKLMRDFIDKNYPHQE